MKILMSTTYYHPHVSGLTLYFQRLAEELARRGHDVTIITARFEKQLAGREIINGVNVVRSRPLFKINKGIALPFIISDSWKYLQQADLVHLNLPSIESVAIAGVAKFLKKPVISTYVCDLTLPPFFGSRLLDSLIDLGHLITLSLSDKVVSYTKDFAYHSRVLKRFSKSTAEIYPPVEIPSPVLGAHPKLSRLRTQARAAHPLLGMATRFATDKGIEYLLNALPLLTKKLPNPMVAFAGNTMPYGEETYLRKLQPLINQYHNRLIFLGELPPGQMPYFYRAIDLLVVSSVNSTEAFGMVQAEAMLQGTPVVATNLPGVRVPIQVTGMGEIAQARDSRDLAKKITQVLSHRDQYIQPIEKIRASFNQEASVEAYLKIYEEILHT